MNFLKKVFSTIYDLVEATTFALGFVFVTYLFFFQTAQVHGASSYPTLKENERYVVEKVSYRFSSPARGDFIIMQSPLNPEVEFVKRIIGLPLEKVMVSQGKVYINGYELDESSYLPPNTFTGSQNFLKENQKMVIPQDYYFVMGDNRANSSDSRDFGPVAKEKIIGKVLWQFWPLESLGKIP